MALFTFDEAAPVEFTAAPFRNFYFFRMKPSTTAHKLAAIDGFGRLVTLPATGS